MITKLPPRLSEEEEKSLAEKVIDARERMKFGDPSSESEYLSLRNSLVLGITGRYGYWLAKRYIHWRFSQADAIQMAFLCSLEACNDPNDLIQSIKRSARRGIARHGRSEERYRSRNGHELAFDPSFQESHFEERIASVGVREKVEKCLGLLSDQYAQIFRLRFGIDDGQPLEFDEIGERLGMSEVSVVQAYQSALLGLRFRMKYNTHKNPSKIESAQSRRDAKRQRILDAIQKIKESGEAVSNFAICKLTGMNYYEVSIMILQLEEDKISSKDHTKISVDLKRQHILSAIQKLHENNESITIASVSKMANMYWHDVLHLMREMRSDGLIPKQPTGPMSRIRKRNREREQQERRSGQNSIQENSHP